MAARNKTIDVIRKNKREKIFASEISYLLQSEYTLGPTLLELVNENQVEDNMLRMMFTCCHPRLSREHQVTLILKTLCGFSIPEIARAFLTGNDSIEKRLYRSRQQFREEKIGFEFPPPAELENRLDAVLLSIYLLFNEGYNSSGSQDLIRIDLLEEAMRLTEILARHPLTSSPKVFALQALMCFTNARNPARLDAGGNILLLKQQNRKLWNQEMVKEGIRLLDKASAGEKYSTYHLEAAIACEHCLGKSFEETNWALILHYYNLLMELEPTAVVALNRMIVIAQVYGPAYALEQVASLQEAPSMKNYYLFYAVVADLHRQQGNWNKAVSFLETAMRLTKSPAEKKLLGEKIEECVVKKGNK